MLHACDKTDISLIGAGMRRLCVAALLVFLPAQAAAATLHGPGDTGIVSVSSEKGVSQGEEPLSVNPADPNQLTAVANVFEPDFPQPLNPFIGGGGIQDT